MLSLVQCNSFQAHLVLFFFLFRIVISQHKPQAHLKPSTEGRAARRRSDNAAAERAVRTCFIMVADRFVTF